MTAATDREDNIVVVIDEGVGRYRMVAVVVVALAAPIGVRRLDALFLYVSRNVVLAKYKYIQHQNKTKFEARDSERRSKMDAFPLAIPMGALVSLWWMLTTTSTLSLSLSVLDLLPKEK